MYLQIQTVLLMMDTDDSKSNDATAAVMNGEASEAGKESSGRMFTLKKWNAVAMWSWDVECDTCAICRVQVDLMSSFNSIVT